jgi:hypothetical protein
MVGIDRCRVFEPASALVPHRRNRGPEQARSGEVAKNRGVLVEAACQVSVGGCSGSNDARGVPPVPLLAEVLNSL